MSPPAPVQRISPRSGSTTIFLVASLLFCCMTVASANEPVDYANQVKPILKARCFACHGALEQKSDLRLDTVSSIHEGGTSGPAVIAKRPNQSELIARIASQDAAMRMPPMGPPLASQEIDRIGRWIQEGASGPANESPEADPRDHWAFRKPLRLVPPHTKTPQAIDNPIDAFILASLGAKGITPRPLADKRTWSGFRPLVRKFRRFSPTIPPLHTKLWSIAC
jgi:mono/diheme cytochrome c family protein